MEVGDLLLGDLVILEDAGDRLERDIAALVALGDQPGDAVELEQRRVVDATSGAGGTWTNSSLILVPRSPHRVRHPKSTTPAWGAE